jgi:hypothetical protein
MTTSSQTLEQKIENAAEQRVRERLAEAAAAAAVRDAFQAESSMSASNRIVGSEPVPSFGRGS